ncbi:MAG: DUF4115 domain-containing protein, partial [Caldilineaceae bacterium]|nr:DUF4115 domain-containing protein [Caldilineaceae bacterium]
MHHLHVRFTTLPHTRHRPKLLISALFTAAILCLLLLVGLRQANAQQTYTVTVDVTTRSWIEATVDGAQAYYGILEAGRQESWTGAQITVLIGNAGGVDVSVGGQRLGYLGASGQVITLRWPEDADRYPVQGGVSTQPTPTAPPPSTNTPIPSPTATPSPTVTATVAETVSETGAVTDTQETVVTEVVTATPEITPVITLTATEAISVGVVITREATVHIVQPGDTLGEIATTYAIDLETLQTANNLPDPNVISVGWVLVIPGSDGSLPENVPTPAAPQIEARGTITERMTIFAQGMSPESPFYNQTWLTYYGRPNVPIMGILGEF